MRVDKYSLYKLNKFIIKEYFNKLSPILEKIQLSEQSCKYYATWIKKAKLSQIKQFPNKLKLYLHLLAFIQHQFYLRQDTLLHIFLKSVQLVRNKIIKQLTQNE